MSVSVVKCSWVKCGKVLQCSDGLSNKVKGKVIPLLQYPSTHF